QKNHVYLVQIPRCGCIPSTSPFALKLETWLRFCKIIYINISNEFTKYSEKGQIPFIELNGRHYADSNQIIELLKTKSVQDPDVELNAFDRAQFVAFHSLLEDSIAWTIPFNRSRDNVWFTTKDKGFAGHFSGVKQLLFAKIGLPKIAKLVSISISAARNLNLN
ncbi:hypothetical protein PMAYCL1PPCAC_22758, partial [Pristionchus mayeri]